MKKKLVFHIITMATYGSGLSGGDRIWIELAKRIGSYNPVHIYLWEEGLSIAKREKLKTATFHLWSAEKWARFGFFINYFARIFIAISNVLKLKVTDTPHTIVYSASEFWQDSIPSLILKLRFPKIRWAAAWYMTAPNPLRGFKEKGSLYILPQISNLAYWLVQQPVKPLIQRYADFVFVTSEPDRKHFPKQNKKNRVVVIKGGVDLERVKVFKKTYRKNKKIYDAVFQGRFHPQKGVLELVDIWKMIVAKKPNAKLAMIGDGPLIKSVQLKVKNKKLENNIKLFGYVFDGSKKYKIFQQSRIVVHPAVYDSGGMAAAEAMAFGLPGVSFDLLALKTYYPKGMVKVSVGNLSEFVEVILRLLRDEEYYLRIKKDALDLVQNAWSWDSLVDNLLIRFGNIVETKD